MPQQQYIKFLREIEGLNITQIAESLNIDWRTVKKYADRGDWNIVLSKREKAAPVMDPFKEIVDIWLAEDCLLPRKQRHTAARIYHRLCAEHHFTGSYRTVSSFVNKRKIEMDLEKAKTYERLEHPAGEAQVDFCTIQVSRDSELRDYKLLVMSFPFSNAAFVHPMPSENQECFLEGLKTLFYKAGGVPGRIWFDNLSAAVASIEKDGERKLHGLFTRFMNHYRFEAIFCNPASGNEKGHVENKCGYGRRNWCVPIPIFESHEKLVAELDVLAAGDMDRPHYLKGNPIRELWEHEKTMLNRLAETDFEVFRLESRVINKYGEIKVDKASFVVFGSKPGDSMLLRLWWDQVEVLDRDYKVLSSIPRPYTGKMHEIPWSEVFKGFLRKPRSVRHSQFTRLLPPALREYLGTENLSERKERIAAMTNWCCVYPITEIANTIGKLHDNATVSMVTNILALTVRRDQTVNKEFQEPYTPAEIRKSVPDLVRYNTLTKGGERV